MAYNPAIADYVCEQLALGRSLLRISKDAPDGMTLPNESTLREWETKNPEHGANSQRARELGTHHLAEECLDIADDATNDWMEREAGPQLNSEHVQRSRLRIDTRLRLIGQWNKPAYGPHSTATVTLKRDANDYTDAELIALAQAHK